MSQTTWEKTALAFGRMAEPIALIGEAEFLARIQWAPGTDAAVVAAARSGDGAEFFRKWRASIAGGSSTANGIPLSLFPLLAHRSSPRAAQLADWLAGQAQPSRSKRLQPSLDVAAPVDLSKFTKSSLRKLVDWLDLAEHPDAPALTGDEVHVLLELLRQGRQALPADAGFRVFRLALCGALRLDQAAADDPLEDVSPAEEVFLRGELPWEAGLLFAHVAGAGKAHQRGRKTLRRQLLRRTDSDGTPHAELMERLPEWLGALSRSTEWSEAYGASLWDESHRERYAALVKMASRFCRPDGRIALSNGALPTHVPLLKRAAAAAGLKKKSNAVQFLDTLSRAGDSGDMPKSLAKKQKRGAHPVAQSDWGEIACLRNAWSPTADLIAIAHQSPLPALDMSVLGRCLLSGVWGLDVSFGDETIDFAEGWSCTCWYSDSDVDYLELQTEFDDGTRIERQVMLARQDHLCLLADSVSGGGFSRIEYVSRLPLADGVSAVPDSQSREVRLTAGGVTARIFPLALPDDRIVGSSGSFRPAEDDPRTLELRQAAIGGLYAPVLIDWSPQRTRAYADWNALTVTEAGEIVGSDTAWGHRWRLDDLQLLIYRSLRLPAVPRSVLGLHTTSETYIGKVDAEGDVESLLMVDAE